MTQQPLFDGVSNEDNPAKFIGQRLYYILYCETRRVQF